MPWPPGSRALSRGGSTSHTTGGSAISNGWIKSSLSFANGNCVEVQYLTDGGVQVRNSRDHSQGVLTYTAEEWRDFLGGVRNGEFDGFGGNEQ
jgi:Domain of unknown function (DUF397)